MVYHHPFFTKMSLTESWKLFHCPTTGQTTSYTNEEELADCKLKSALATARHSLYIAGPKLKMVTEKIETVTKKIQECIAEKEQLEYILALAEQEKASAESEIAYCKLAIEIAKKK